MLESRAERRALGASLRGARHSSSRRWLEFSESKKLSAESHEQINPHPISRKKAVLIFPHKFVFVT